MNEHQRDEWTLTLIAYVNGTLDAADCAAVDAALAESDDLRRELDEIDMLRRAVVVDSPPATVPAGVWDRVDAPAEREAAVPPLPPPPGPAAVPPPPSLPTPPTPIRRRGRWTPSTVVAAAAAVVALVIGGIVVSRLGSEGEDSETLPSSTATGGSAPTAEGPGLLDAPPLHALRRTTIAMTSARTARLDVSGRGVVRFDGALVGEPGIAEVVLDISGQGAVDFGDGDPANAAYQLTTVIEGVSGPPLALPERTESDTIVVDGRQYDSEDGGPYSESDAGDPDDQGLFARAVLGADVLARLPELAVGDIEELGREHLDGVEVRHLRFNLKPDLLGETGSSNSAEVWIDDTGLVHRFRATSTGPFDLFGSDGTITLTMDIDVEDFGEPVEISAPS